MRDLIERLCEPTDGWSGDSFCIDADTALEAADELTALRAHVSELRADLEVVRGVLDDTQSTLSAVKAEATVDGGGTCLWIAEKLNQQMVDNAAILNSIRKAGVDDDQTER